MKIDATAQFWRTKGLSVRASNCLAKANIANEQELIHKFTTFDSLIALSNCGRKTAEEIWKFLTNLKFVPNYDQETKITSSNRDEYSPKAQSVFIPLLNIKVSAQTWEALQKTPINSIRLSFRTRNVINQQRLQELAEVAKLSPREWLRFRNFGRTSLIELQECLTETVKQLEANLDMLDPSDEPPAPNPERFVEMQSVFIPLLNKKVSAQTWIALQNRSIHQLTWSVRTKNILLTQDFKTLAEIAELPPKQWLKFRNFGRKSLTEIQEIVNKIIANPNVLDPKSDHSVEVSQIQTLTELGRVVFQRLQIRQQEVVKHYYGYGGTPKNLQQIGEILGITRERVRQIKKTANTKINQGADNHLITTTIFRLLSKSIHDLLSQYGGFCAAEKLQEIIHQRLEWKNKEQWIINWFNEAFGKGWICLGTDEYKIVDGVCHLKLRESFQGFLAQLASRLKHYGYRPLVLEKCQYLIQKMDGVVYNGDNSSIAFDSDRLLNMITSYPSLKVYQYGKTLIGLKAWTWFNPEKPMTFAGQASLIEWYLRMTNEAAMAKAIANGIGSQLGNFRLTSFDVAHICEKHPYRFQVDDNGAYGLHIWEESSKYRQVLTELLSDETLSIEQIAEVLSPRESADTMLITAALNFSDSFVETTPFEWALKSQTDTIGTEATYNSDSGSTVFDYNNLTFEDLMPKL